jgi:abhydrolase domain-containing protein 17
LKEIKGVILECPLMSCIRVVTQTSVLRPFDMFNNIIKVPKFTSPTYIMHGSIDEVIDQEHGRELYKALPLKYQYTPQ